MSKIDFENIKKGAVIIEDNSFSHIDGKFLRRLRMDLGMSQLLFADLENLLYLCTRIAVVSGCSLSVLRLSTMPKPLPHR